MMHSSRSTDDDMSDIYHFKNMIPCESKSDCNSSQLSQSAVSDIRQLCQECDPCYQNNKRNDGCYKITSVKHQDVHTRHDNYKCPDNYNNNYDKPYRPTRNNLENSCFDSLITPLSNLKSLHNRCNGSVQFTMRRKNKTVTLQWEPFSGTLAANGVAFLTVVQTICNVPPYPINIPIYLEYKGIGRITRLNVNPDGSQGNLKFYFNIEGSSNETTVGDLITVPGGVASWIVD